MKKVIIALLILTCISCSKNNDDFYENGKLKYEALEEECESVAYYPSIWSYLSPSYTKYCYQYYDGEKFTGIAVSLHKNGKPAVTIKYSNGSEIERTVLDYFSNGQIKQESFINDSEIKEKDYFKNGVLRKHIISSKRNSRVYFRKEFYESGQLKYEKTVSGEIEYFSDGSLKSKYAQEYKNGQYKNERIKYYDNKQLQIKEIIHGAKKFRERYTEHGKLLEYYDTDSILILKDPKTFTIIKSGKFKETYKNGLWETFYSNGQLKSICHYDMGFIKGEKKEYHKNGKIAQKENYENGVIEGLSVSYHENGKWKIKATYKSGHLEGTYIEYFKNGIIKVKGEYINDDKVGLFKYFNEDGTLYEAIRF